MLSIIISIFVPRNKNENNSVLSCLNMPAHHHSKASAFTLRGTCVLGKEYYLCPAAIVSWD